MWTKAQWAAFSAWLAENGDYDFAASEKIPAHIRDWGKHSWLKYSHCFRHRDEPAVPLPQSGPLHLLFRMPVSLSAKRKSTFQVPLDAGRPPEKAAWPKPGESRLYDAWMEKSVAAVLPGRESLCVDLYGAKETFLKGSNTCSPPSGGKRRLLEFWPGDAPPGMECAVFRFPETSCGFIS